MRALLLAGFAVLGALAVAPRAGAAVWVEQGDAGQLPGTAQVTTNLLVAELDRITGTLGTAADVDAFLIRITDPAAFSATTVGQPGSLFDNQLFLFTADGFGVEASDEAGRVGTGRAALPAGNPNAPTAPGLYLLAISAFNNNPVSPGGQLIFPEPSGVGGTVGPTGPGGEQALTGWTGTGFSSGTYEIALTGAEFAQGPPSVVIPEPSGLVLLGTGVLGAAFARWRRRRAA